jgi:hypothetical protein
MNPSDGDNEKQVCRAWLDDPPRFRRRRSRDGRMPATLRASWRDKTPSARARPAQVLVFDTFGTLVDWRCSVIAEGQALGRAKGLHVDWVAFADAWRAGYASSLNRVRRGHLPWRKLDALHRMTLNELFLRFKIDGLTEEEKVHVNRGVASAQAVARRGRRAHSPSKAVRDRAVVQRESVASSDFPNAAALPQAGHVGRNLRTAAAPSSIRRPPTSTVRPSEPRPK